MDEGTFVGWLKKDGESVKAGEPLFTLESEKASQDVEATDDGTLSIPTDAPKAGDPVTVGSLLGYLLGEGERGGPSGAVLQVAPVVEQRPPGAASVALEPFAQPVAPAPSLQEVAGAGGPISAVTISPRARRRAADLAVDYSRLRGSGRTGRIREADVLAAARVAPGGGLSTMRRTIAQRTAESFARAPHFYLRTEVDATALLELRDRLLPGIERETGLRLTLTDLLLRAHALALRDCPCANAIWQEDQMLRMSACDVGLVVGLDGGLLIPIVRGADASDLAELLKQRAGLVEAARAGRLSAEVMQGGATSLSNLGNTCVDEFAAVIAPPQSSMLAVGRAAPRPWVVDGLLAVRTTLRLCLSVDHRVMDGGPAAEFLGRIVERIQHPELLGAS